MTKSIEQIKIRLKCPGCGKEIREIWKARLDTIIGIRYAFICVECNKLISLRKEKELIEFNYYAV